jgi:hypothetical protein
MEKVQKVSNLKLTTVFLEMHRISCLRGDNDKNYIIEEFKGRNFMK